MGTVWRPLLHWPLGLLVAHHSPPRVDRRTVNDMGYESAWCEQVYEFYTVSCGPGGRAGVRLARGFGVLRISRVHRRSSPNSARHLSGRIELVCDLGTVSWGWRQAGRGVARVAGVRLTRGAQSVLIPVLRLPYIKLFSKMRVALWVLSGSTIAVVCGWGLGEDVAFRPLSFAWPTQAVDLPRDIWKCSAKALTTRGSHRRVH